MRFDNIRTGVGRKTLKSLKVSTWNTIRMIIKKWGLVEEVHYKVDNIEGTLTFWNDSIIIMKELAMLADFIFIYNFPLKAQFYSV